MKSSYNHKNDNVYEAIGNGLMPLIDDNLISGLSGLEELVKLNPKFEEFHLSLFDLSSRSLERSVEDKKANKKLNKIIRKFLLLLSPYFLIKSAHKALEWLVNR